MLQLIDHSQMVITLTKHNLSKFRKLTHFAWGLSMWSMKVSVGVDNLRERKMDTSDILNSLPLPSFDTLQLVRYCDSNNLTSRLFLL